MNKGVSFCKSCVMPTSSVALSVNEDNICSACEYHKVYQSITNDEWEIRKKKFKKNIK